MIRIYALEYRAVFLAEERSKTYKQYDARVPQVKMLLSVPRTAYKTKLCLVWKGVVRNSDDYLSGH